MEKHFLNQVKACIPLYNLEWVLMGYGRKAKKRGYYERAEFMRICLWKSSRQKTRYKSNTGSKIKSITRKAFLLNDEKARIKMLCTLSGVGIPVASALLTFHSYNKYAIIDVRCIKVMKKQKLITWRHITPNNWVNYMEVLREQSRKMNITPRQLEKGLFTYHREKQIDDNFQNVYIKKRR